VSEFLHWTGISTYVYASTNFSNTLVSQK